MITMMDVVNEGLLNTLKQAQETLNHLPSLTIEGALNNLKSIQMPNVGEISPAHKIIYRKVSDKFIEYP